MNNLSPPLEFFVHTGQDSENAAARVAQQYMIHELLPFNMLREVIVN